jgi:hypothetical protein
MESKDYSYWQELGNQNNHLGWTRFNNKVEVEIPDTCEQETKLIVYAIGYEPLFIDISNIQNESHIFVHLTPKIYSSSILLTESKSSRIKPFLVDHINPPRPEIKTETQTQIFYGRGPKWNYCMVCYPELWVARIEDFSLKEIHRELKKGKKVSVLLHINKSEEVEAIEIEGFSGKKILPKIQQDMQKSRWRFDDTRMNNGFQYRVHFVLNRKNETMYLREMGQRK